MASRSSSEIWARPRKSSKTNPNSYYEHLHGSICCGDAISWLSSMKSSSVDMIFADPPYNIKKAEWDYFDSQQEYVRWSLEWIKEAARVLKPEGTLYVCGFSEMLADIKYTASPIFRSCRWLVWHYKNKANMGKDWGRSHESILHLRKSSDFTFNVDNIRIPYGNHTLKYPERPQAETSAYGNGKPPVNAWRPHPRGAKPRDVIEIPTTNNGMSEKTHHPTQKPEELLRKLILASSNEGDLVLDPFLGSGTTIVAAEQLNRQWAGCDLSAEYCDLAVQRVKNVEHRKIEEWIEFDQKNTERRRSIR